MRARGAGGTDDKVLGIHRQHGAKGAVGAGHHHKARARVKAGEKIGLHPAGSLGHGGGDEAADGFGQVGAGGGDVDHRSQRAIGPEDGGRGAGQPDVAGKEMLVAVDRHGAGFGKAGADAVGPGLRFGPSGACPEAGGGEVAVVAGMSAAVQRHAIGIGQNDAGAKAAHGLKETVEMGGCGGQKHAGPFLRKGKFRCAEPVFEARIGRVEAVERGRARPRGRKGRTGGVARADGRFDTGHVLTGRRWHGVPRCCG